MKKIWLPPYINHTIIIGTYMSPYWVINTYMSNIYQDDILYRYCAHFSSSLLDISVYFENIYTYVHRSSL